MAGQSGATIVGTERATLHGCAMTSCPIQGQVPLGTRVATAGVSMNGFIAVATDVAWGYVRDLYLQPDGGPAPVLTAGEPGCGRVALIFNIGIGEEPASSILDTLDREDIVATMFVMGWWAEQNPPILQRMVRDGFPIGSHGFERNELTTLSDEAVRKDIQQASRAIEQATGAPPVRLFTPYAAAGDDRIQGLIAAEGYLPVSWDVPAADYGPEATEEGVYERILRDIHDGAIVELHLDGPASAMSTGRALPRVIRDLRNQGYRFVTIPEMAVPCS